MKVKKKDDNVTEYSVSELNDEINICLTTVFENKIRVVGEISGFKVSRGHAYFTLKDEDSSISCIIWKSTMSKINENLANGDQIIGTGKISTYKKSGTYQLIIYKVECDGLGGIHEKYNELKEKMEKNGYFDQKYKKSLPKIIKNIGIISAEGGAALHDVVFALKSKNYYGNVYFQNCSVQGSNCPKTVCEAIDYFCNIKDKIDLDVILITRGGGSFEDLMGFSDETLIKKIYDCPVCIISAVGHEVDFMLSDFVADIRAPTPSIAGSMIVGQQVELKNDLEKMVLMNKIRMNEITKKFKERLYDVKSKLVDPSIILEQQLLKVNGLVGEIDLKMMNKFAKDKNKYQYLKNKFKTYNPDKQLAAGLNVLFNEDGTIVKSIDFFKNRKFIDNLTLKMNDGEVKIKILL